MELPIRKIRQVRPEYNDSCGPSTSYTLGFMVGERSFILGTFYVGPYMEPEHGDEMKAVESIIDRIVSLGIPPAPDVLQPSQFTEQQNVQKEQL